MNTEQTLKQIIDELQAIRDDIATINANIESMEDNISDIRATVNHIDYYTEDLESNLRSEIGDNYYIIQKVEDTIDNIASDVKCIKKNLGIK